MFQDNFEETQRDELFLLQEDVSSILIDDNDFRCSHQIYEILQLNETLTLESVVVLLLDNQVHCCSGLNCRLKLIRNYL